MECKICLIKCINKNEFDFIVPSNIAIIDINGDIYCLKCKDIADFASDIMVNNKINDNKINDNKINENKINDNKINENKINKNKIIQTYICIKCKENYKGEKCKCGFKNPLYR